MMKRRLALSLALGVSVFVAACSGGGKEAADTAITAAQSAFDAAKVEASRYAPDQVKAVEDSLTAAKDSLARGNYAQALTEAQGLTSKISGLGAAVAAKKTELTKSWGNLSAGLPRAVDAIQSRVDILSKSKKLPATISKESFDGAKGGLDTITKTLAEANDAFKSGNMVEAVAKAQTVKAKAAEVMTAIGMQVPDALK